MSGSTLIRFGGFSAILAGLLRAGSSFIPFFTTEPGIFLEVLYLIIDVLILIGLLGVYGYQYERAGLWGFIGFLLALIGTAIIVGPDGRIGSVEMYTLGAGLISVGMLFLAIGTWSADRLSRWVPILWVVSTVVGIGGFLMGGSAWTFLIAGLTFGLAFVVAGFKLWTDPGSKLPA
jgi:hypothetical protein